jgi:hypothetical protein
VEAENFDPTPVSAISFDRAHWADSSPADQQNDGNMQREMKRMIT